MTPLQSVMIPSIIIITSINIVVSKQQQGPGDFPLPQIQSVHNFYQTDFSGFEWRNCSTILCRSNKQKVHINQISWAEKHDASRLTGSSSLKAIRDEIMKINYLMLLFLFTLLYWTRFRSYPSAIVLLNVFVKSFCYIMFVVGEEG